MVCFDYFVCLGGMMSGSLFSSRAPPPIAPTPQQWSQLVTLQEPSDVYGLESDGDNACLICMSSPKETVLLPCRYVVTTITTIITLSVTTTLIIYRSPFSRLFSIVPFSPLFLSEYISC